MASMSIRRCIAALAFFVATASSQTTNLTTTLSTGQIVTIPVTVGTPVVSAPVVTPPAGGSTTAPPGGGGSTTPPTSGSLSKMSLGLNGNPNGFIPATISDFYKDISTLPVDSAKTKAWQTEYCGGSALKDCDHMHLDNTMPYSVVTSPTFNTVTFTDSADSDNVKYPVSATTPTEGGAPIGQPCPAAGAASGVCTKGKTITSDGDHHAIVINRDTGTAYEVYQFGASGSKFTGYAGEAWNMLAPDIRTKGRNSADAAGLPIYPLLINYDEESTGSGGHAFRFTCNNTNTQFIYPATHSAGGSDSCYPGMRVRLRSSFVVSSTWSKQVQAVMNDLKKYGAYVADNGSNFMFTAVSDSRWTDDDMTALGNLNEGVFDVVNTGYYPQSLPQ